jgi:DNA invertase Pin-like site-specific DNA recombinase
MAVLPMLLAAEARLRHEAVLTGKAKARSRGVKFGRPPVGMEELDRLKSALATGMGIRPAARAAGVSPATVMWVSAGLCAAPVTALRLYRPMKHDEHGYPR